MLRTALAATLAATMTIGSDSFAKNGPGGASASGSRSTQGPTVPPVLRRIAQCESGGDPTAVSPNGLYRGKYQFSRPTWRAYGGEGDPAAAPEAEQDRRAIKLYRAEGTTPWPNCA